MSCLKRRFFRGKWWWLAGLAAIAVSFDLALSDTGAVEGTFCPEARFQPQTYPQTTVSIVTSDYDQLASPIARTTNPTYEQVEAMVRKAIELQGGFSGVIEENDKVMLKVNLVGANSASGNGENTDVRVVKALVKLINEFTAGKVEIWIAEGSARNNDDVTSTSSVWQNSGYRALLTDTYLSGINFKLLNINQTISDLVEVDLGSQSVDAYQGSKYFIHKAVVDADVYIAVPVLKVHNTGMTGALKLQIGIAPGCYYGYNKMAGSTPLYHDVGHRRWTDEAIVDLSSIAKIDYVVVDALMCLDLQKTDKTSNRVRFNTILAGKDPVAVDNVCTRLFCLNPDDIAHITLAEKVGLGTNDPEKITVVGVPIDSVKKQIRKNQDDEGKFGQSNRTWILSKAFSGTDMTTEYLTGEAQLKPEPGKGDWSEPMFFFDDRIDLLSYYKEATGIVTYAYTRFNAPKAQKAELWMASHEAIRVYLNGAIVYDKTTTTTLADATRGSSVATIDLLAGENHLMVKSLNRFGDYTFSLNICEVESDPYYAGNRVEGLVFNQGNGTGKGFTSQLSPTFEFKAFPNPTASVVRFSFQSDQIAPADIAIFDMSGKKVRSLRAETHNGTNEVTWDLSSNSGTRVKQGPYLCTLTLGGVSVSTKLTVK